MTYEAYRVLPNVDGTGIIEHVEGDLITTVGAVKLLNELTELRRIAALLRARVGYAFISQDAVFTFIHEWDKAVKQTQKSPGD